MKFTFLLLIISMLHVSASTKAQNITIDKQNASLKEVFRELRRQTDYDFIYSAKQLIKAKKVSLHVTNSSLIDVLEKCFINQPLTYQINEKTITIKEKPAGFLDRLMDRFTDIDVRGVVHDDQGMPLAGATVTIKETDRSVRTNEKGVFYLENVGENTSILITYLGYETKELKVARDLGNIVLTPIDARLDEVIVNAGYYTVKEKERTGSISSVSSATISKQPVNNPLMALQNRVPGLEITQLTGVPGGGFTVRVRGENSLKSGNEPLYIIDGVTFPSSKLTTGTSFIQGNGSPLSTINPADIDRIEVLKDADATAIYGSRGANGVILINTKKAAIGEQRISVNVSQGFAEVGHKLDLMNTEQYLAMRIEASRNAGVALVATDMDVNGMWDKDKYTDWQELMIGGRANTANASMNISGGTLNSSYLLSGNYTNEGTVFPGSFSFKRGGLHTNLNLGSAAKRLNANFSGTYSRSVSLLPVSEPTSSILHSPNAPDAYDEFGQLNWYDNGVAIGSNPMATLLNTTAGTADNLIGNVILNYKLIRNLTVKASFGYNTLKKEELKTSLNAARNPATNPTSENRQSEFGNITNSSWTFEPQLNYGAELGRGKVNALLGMSFQESTAEYRNVVAKNFSSDEVVRNISSATTFSVNDVSYGQYKYAALFARLNYSLLDRYYLNLTARRDGSSRFGPGKQFANFGAVGAAWIFSEERVVREYLPFLSFGKLRGSYGVTGNDQIQDYQYMDLYIGANSYQGMPAISASGIRNPNFAWETNSKSEVALDLGFFKDRINIQVAYFRNRSSNQLLRSLLPPSVGSAAVIANLPATVQNAGWEFDSTFKLITSSQWSWKASFNLSIPKNKLVAYPGLENSSDRVNYIVGQPLKIQRYYNTSVDLQTGLYITEDVNQNGQRDDADKYLNKFMGQIFYGGFQNTITYKQFSIDFLTSFTKQNGNSYIYGISVPGIYSNSTANYNHQVYVLSRWQKPGDASDIPRFGINSAAVTNFGLGKDGIQGVSDASFARLKNVSISYDLPAGWISKAHVQNFQLFAQGQNLLTLTSYDGLDPEIPSSTALKLPPLRAFLMGLKITL